MVLKTISPLDHESRIALLPWARRAASSSASSRPARGNTAPASPACRRHMRWWAGTAGWGQVPRPRCHCRSCPAPRQPVHLWTPALGDKNVTETQQLEVTMMTENVTKKQGNRRLQRVYSFTITIHEKSATLQKSTLVNISYRCNKHLLRVN